MSNLMLLAVISWVCSNRDHVYNDGLGDAVARGLQRNGFRPAGWGGKYMRNLIWWEIQWAVTNGVECKEMVPGQQDAGVSVHYKFDFQQDVLQDVPKRESGSDFRNLSYYF